MNDAELIARFEAGTLSPADFDHSNHLRVAWLYLRREPFPVALTRVTAGLKRLTERLGAPDKYHETITCAFVCLLAERMGRTQPAATSWERFIGENADLLTQGREVLSAYYSEETLLTPLARRTFILPRPAPRVETISPA